MPIKTESDVTPAVLEVMERTRDPRLREIMISLVKHLHGFVREVRLTEAEFRDATAILNEIGKLASDSHNEIVLMAGSLGVSTLVCLLNNGDNGQTETSQSLLGPFWRLNSPRVENGGTIIRSDTPGTPLFVTARVQDRDGQPDRRRRGRRLARLAGRALREPGPRPGGDEPARQVHHRRRRALLVPDRQDGRLSDPDRRRGRPAAEGAGPPSLPPGASACADLQATGFKTLISQVYDPSDPHIDTDVQFGVTQALDRRLRPPRRAAPERVRTVGAPWYSLDYTYVMEPGEAKLPRPPIK